MAIDPATRIGVVGGTGAVGNVTLSLLRERGYENVRVFASARSAGKKLKFLGNDITVEELTETVFQGIDIAFFSAGGSIFPSRWSASTRIARLATS